MVALPHPALEVLAEPRHQHAVLIGDAGAGKSTLLRYLLLDALEPHPGEAPVLPLLVELRDFRAHYDGGKCDKYPDTGGLRRAADRYRPGNRRLPRKSAPSISSEALAPPRPPP